MRKLVLSGKGIFTGRGSLEALEQYSFEKVMIVTGGSSMMRTGVVDRVRGMLEKNNSHIVVYSGVPKNPSIADVQKGLEQCLAFGPDCILALGGGSAMDCAKAILLFYEFPYLTFENVLEYNSRGEIPTERKTALICVPSTSGTGSEVTRGTVITDPEQELKVPIMTDCLRPDLAILDPDIVMTMPKNIAAETGMDALTHAIEAYVSTDANPLTDAAAQMAITMITQYLPKAVANGAYMKARDKMAYGQYLAGIAFNNASLGYVHAMAHQLGGFYNLPHGVCNAILLPHVEEFNLIGNANRFRNIAKAMGENVDGLSTMDAARKAISAIRQLSQQVGIPSCLRELGVKEEDFEIMAENAMKDVCQLTNPRKATKEQIVGIFKAAY